MLALLAMGSVSLWAEGLPADTRLRELHLERSNHSARPVPANVSLADVIGNEIEVFDNENDSHKEGTHAFFIQLGDKTALALGYEHQYGGKGPSEVRFKGQLVKLGPLLRTPANAAHSLMWVWEADLPPGAVPLVRENLALPLIMYQDEMTILTSEGPKEAVLTKTHPSRAILPGQAIGDSAEIKLDEADSYKAIRVGDPVIQTRTGIVVAAVRGKEPWLPSMKEPADIDIVWLSFPRPPEPLSTPLTEVWGATVPSNPSVDEAFVQKLMPARALGMKMGESIDDARERNPLLVRWPPEAENRYDTDDYFGQEWVFADQQTETENGRIVGIRYGSSASIGSKTTMVFANWLAEKFQPKEIRKSTRGTDLLSIWNQGNVWVAAFLGLRDTTISVDMRVSGKGEEALKAMFNQEHYTTPAKADKSTFLSLATALANQANKDDFGVTEKLSLQNPVTATSSSSSGQVVMKRNGQDINVTAPAKPVTAPKTEEPAQHTLAPPPSSRLKEEIRSMAVQQIETLGRVVQAYNAMPANLRETARVQSVTGAFGLLRTHAERYPDLPLDDDLRHTMEWALVFLDTGKLQGSPALQKLAQVINAEIALEKAQHTAQEAATAFAAAKKAGSKELNKLKTIEDILQRLNAGVKGTGTSKAKVFTAKSTPEQAAQIVPHLRYDAAHQTLRYLPKSVKVEGSDVPLEGIHALARLIEHMPEARLTPQTHITSTSGVSGDDGIRIAQDLCSIFGAAHATGSTEFAHLKTVEAFIQRLNAGVKGGAALGGAFKDKTFIMKTTPEEAAAAKRHLSVDLAQNLLLYKPVSTRQGGYNQPIRAQQVVRDPTDEAKRTAQRLAAIYDVAVSTGSKDIDQLQTLDEVINRLTTTGLIGGPGPLEGKSIYTKTKPGENEAAKPYLRYDSFTKTLKYSATPIGGSRSSSTALSANETRPTVMNVGRAVGGGVTFGGRTFANTAEMEKAIRESHEAAKQALHTRNAQALVSIYNAARSSGSQALDNVGTVDQAIRLIVAGVKGGGIYKERTFLMPATPDQVAGAKPYIEFDSRRRALVYKSPYR